MEDNIWEYPFGDIDEDDDFYCCRIEETSITHHRMPIHKCLKAKNILI